MENVSLTRLFVIYEEISNFIDEITTEDDFKTLREKLQKNTNVKKQILKILPNMTVTEICSLLYILKIDRETHRSKENQVEFVGTFPADVECELRKTISVVRQIIIGAEKSILITGYSISEFINEIIDLLLSKSQQGINVRFFIDKGVDMKTFLDPKFKNSNFKVFKYKMNESFSSLHAKVILIDNKKAFVSSSNLSYNGIVNNIEVGTLVTGEKVNAITSLFDNLLKRDFFIELN